MSTLYDEVLYPNAPFGQTHPDRLATLAILFGMDPAPVHRCRVLEVGCGDGGNLVPMAFENPAAQFLGLDAAARAIRSGKQEIATLGLANIRLEHMDIMEAGPELGTFDYVIAHGFYSWVPEPVRDKLLALTKAVLAPHGVAFVSYNALPGGRVRQMFRDMMLFHLGAATEFDARIQGAHEVVQWFRECQPAEGEWFVFQSQVESILERQPQVLYHDELSAIYHPVYLQEFAAHAARFGLQFLCEANYHDTQPGRLPAAVVAEIDRVANGNRVVRDQYFDFMKCRMFRQTLICHQDVVLPAAPLAARLPLLCAASSAKPVSAKPDLSSGAAEEFRGGRGTGATTAHPLTKAVLLSLSEAWPRTLSIPELLAAAASLTGEPPDAEGVSHILMATYVAGVIELHSQAPHCVARVSQFPTASELARSQARRDRSVATARHNSIEARDQNIRLLIGLLDGTRDLDALTRELAPFSALPAAELAHGIQVNLTLLAEMGLLVG
ncbi:MAG: class I SAM-dependent methyltransferase [Candidatus Solibacter sp.]|nr:class I SAM-dependent methyltransferase [Candidatus Solibacter sp.]